MQKIVFSDPKQYVKKRTLPVFLCILLSLILPFNPSFAIESNIPDIGDYSTILDPRTEWLVGNAILQQINGSDAVVSDPVVNEYLNQMASTFNQYVNLVDFKLHFFSVKCDDLNAFAFPGAHVAIFTGLIMSVNNESELAAVLAHETSHITQRHLARMLAKKKQMTPLMYAELLAAIALGALSPEAGIHAATAVMAGNAQQMINYTRENEEEADRMGIQLLAKTQYDPNAMASVFQRMKQQTMYHDKYPEYLLTHPLFISRIADAQNRAASLPYRQAPDSFFFHLIRARLESETDENALKRTKRLRGQLNAARYHNKTAAEYGYALALIKSGKTNEALQILTRIAEEYPNQWIIELGLAEAELAAGKSDLAAKRLQSLQQMHPQNYAISLQYANLLLDTRKPDPLITLLLKCKRNHADDPMLHQLLARAYSMKKKRVELHQSQAEWHYLRGEYDASFKQLSLALELVKKDSNAASQIRNRMSRMKYIVDSQKKISL